MLSHRHNDQGNLDKQDRKYCQRKKSPPKFNRLSRYCSHTVRSLPLSCSNPNWKFQTIVACINDHSQQASDYDCNPVKVSKKTLQQRQLDWLHAIYFSVNRSEQQEMKSHVKLLVTSQSPNEFKVRDCR